MNLDYFRVIPRDLFNEGKLLTELGFLSLAIHDNKEGVSNVLTMELINEEEGFVVAQNEDDGSLFVSNLMCTTVADCVDSEIKLFTRLNCRDKNALQFSYEPLNAEGVVFSGDNYSNEFNSLLKLLKRMT